MVGRIPSRKSRLIRLALRYTEGLGPRRFYGRVIILVNEHTASAGEMVVAFAEENDLVNRTRRKDSGPTAERQRV